MFNVVFYFIFGVLFFGCFVYHSENVFDWTDYLYLLNSILLFCISTKEIILRRTNKKFKELENKIDELEKKIK
jgi:hypothetical protein